MRILVVFSFFAILTGCGDLLTLHPIYTAQDHVVDPAVEGRWESGDDVLVVRRDKDVYEFTLGGKKSPKKADLEYEAHLVDINGVRFVDLIPKNALGHMFAKVRVADGKLIVNFMDSKWLIGKVPHTMSEVAGMETMPVVTLSTAELRTLVAQYSREAKAYDKDMVFEKTKK